MHNMSFKSSVIPPVTVADEQYTDLYIFPEYLYINLAASTYNLPFLPIFPSHSFAPSF